MIKTSIAKRIGALALIVAGLLSAVLGPAGENTASWRWLGLFLLLLGVYFLLGQRASSEQRAEAAQQHTTTPPLKWYQSPILWVPIVGAIVFLVALALQS